MAKTSRATVVFVQEEREEVYIPSESDTGTSSRGLVHLAEDEGDLGLAVELNDTSLLHFVVQVVTLTSTLADTSEDGVTTVCLGNVVLSRVSRAHCKPEEDDSR